MLEAVIFDFDGVIVDTEPIHFMAFCEVIKADKLSYTWEDYINYFVGYDDRGAFRSMYEKAGKRLGKAKLKLLMDAKALAFTNIIKHMEPMPYPGVVNLIHTLSGEIPLGLCSGAVRSDIIPILDHLDLDTAFNAIVTADDVVDSKPHPASYKRAIEELAKLFPDRNISAASCIAIEDTPTGIESAILAGIKVLAVTNTYEAKELKGAALTVASLEEVNLDVISLLIG